MNKLCGVFALLFLAQAQVAFHEAAASLSDYFAIQVVDSTTGRGVPLVVLTTVNNVSHVTDSAGWIAFREPGLMNQNVFFSVASHGYEFPKDGFGSRGKVLHTSKRKVNYR